VRTCNVCSQVRSCSDSVLVFMENWIPIQLISMNINENFQYPEQQNVRIRDLVSDGVGGSIVILLEEFLKVCQLLGEVCGHIVKLICRTSEGSRDVSDLLHKAVNLGSFMGIASIVSVFGSNVQNYGMRLHQAESIRLFPERCSSPIQSPTFSEVKKRLWLVGRIEFSKSNVFIFHCSISEKETDGFCESSGREVRDSGFGHLESFGTNRSIMSNASTGLFDWSNYGGTNNRLGYETIHEVCDKRNEAFTRKCEAPTAGSKI